MLAVKPLSSGLEAYRNSEREFMLCEIINIILHRVTLEEATEGRRAVSQITARLPETLVEALDASGKEINRGRADLVRQALERYIEDFDDLTVAQERLRDPTDPVLDWNDVRHDVLGPDVH